jgi:hypothetical protein
MDMNNMMDVMQRLIQFQNSFRGNPQMMVQQMLNNGQVTPQQYQNAVNMANQLQQMFTPYGRR